MSNRESIHCRLCGSGRYYLVYRKRKGKTPSEPRAKNYAISESSLEKPSKIVRCMTCGLVYAALDSSLQEIKKDYSDMADEDYVKEEKGRRAQAKSVLSKIAKFKKQGRLLDVGCGPGLFLAQAREQGWEVSGADLSLWAKNYCKENFGIDIFQGTLTEARFPDRSFDVVVMNDVIEHLEDPKVVLSEIRRVLKNDGVVYISTPDIDSFLSRSLGGRWWGINKYHLFYFSRKTLERLFESVGFKRLRYFSYPRIFSLNYWAKRLETYPALIYRPIEFVSRIGNAGKILLKVVLYDQIGVIAKKIQRLDTVVAEGDLERKKLNKSLKVTAVLPAYNAARTLARTVADIPREIVSEIILVDDRSQDDTVKIAKSLGLIVYEHEKNSGYGANQKTCYEKALERGADIVVMVHPDYQYDPKIIPQLIEPIQRGEADAVFGSRMMKGGALEGGMPMWKHNANILLTAFENVMLGTYLTEYHSGFRAYSAKLLRTVNYKANSNGFIFDTQIIVQILANRLKIDEVPIRTRYFEEASSIQLWPSILYGLGIIRVMGSYYLQERGILKNKKLEPVR